MDEVFIGSGVSFEFTSTYTTTKAITITIESQGEYELENGDRWDIIPYYDDISGTPLVLEAGKSKWNVIYYPGINSGGRIINIRWKVKHAESSDSNFNYIVEEKADIWSE